MDAGSVVVGGGDGTEGISCGCVMGGVLEEGGNGKEKSEGGSRRYVPVKEVMGVEEVHRMVKEAVGSHKLEHKLDVEYNRCILPPNNGRQFGRPYSKRMESQSQGEKGRRCSKCSEVGHTRRICHNARADFDADTKMTWWGLKICWVVGNSGSHNIGSYHYDLDYSIAIQFRFTSCAWFRVQVERYSSYAPR
ncbi:hypothetical protein Cgig2_004690 [Carnegiea gigantea]|uniref:Uncharacterized protein n=1 Tax=Carnegiea gigantea TaxID=171969 RepID=A0A9Q1GQR6_9CARY|nr:hypothetical protein Cgig2_004690 [Carnegiea gigantea]